MKRKRVLFIVAHRKDRSPGQRFRFEQYLEYLSQHGYDHDYAPIIPTEEDDRFFYSQGYYFQKARIMLNSLFTRLKNCWQLGRYDLVFIYREALFTGHTFFERYFKRAGVPVILDFDDAIWIPTVSEANKALGWLKNAAKTHELTRLADMVFVGNQYLANYASQYNNNVKVIPTTLDTDKFKKTWPDRDGDVVEIGWTGSFSTVEHFRYRLDALRQVKARYGEHVRFKLIGDPDFYEASLGLKGIAWNSTTEVADLSSIDIGIMPLPDNEWTRGKCGFKGLTYMSLEIPAVMSPVGVNKDIIQDGVNGFLAESTEEWVEKLSRLVDDAQLRRQLGKAGRKTVEERFSIYSQRDRYLKFFNELSSR